MTLSNTTQYPLMILSWCVVLSNMSKYFNNPLRVSGIWIKVSLTDTIFRSKYSDPPPVWSFLPKRVFWLCLRSSLPDQPLGHLKGESGRTREREEGAGADWGGWVGFDHCPPETDNVHSLSQGPSKALVGQTEGDWPRSRGSTRATQLFSQPRDDLG